MPFAFVVLNYETMEFKKAVYPEIALEMAYNYVSQGFNPDLIEVVFYDESAGYTLKEFEEKWG